MRVLITGVMLVILTGCGATGVAIVTEERREGSAAMIGCSPKEISIVNTGNATWEATCKGKTFYCAAAPTSMCTAKMEG